MNPKLLSYFAGKQILITGGLGFIGSNLAIHLVKAGAKVTLIDSLIPEYGGNLFNVEPIQDQVRINISDVRDPFGMNHLVQNHEFLFNLAGQTSHLDSMNYPVADLEINAKAQLHILEACRRYNPGIKIVFASTRQVYGKPNSLPVSEAHPLNPVDINGINKLAGEWYHLLYCRVYGIPACILRLTNTIGPRMRIRDARQTFLGIWIKNILQGVPIEVWGGNQLRDFTYVDDCLEAILLAAKTKKGLGKVFNLGGHEVISLADLAEKLIKIHGSGSYKVCGYPAERKKIDIGDYYSDFSLVRKTLGWTPKTPIAKALKLTLQYFSEHLSSYL